MAEQAVLVADRSHHRGGWVYLDPEDAREHPDYGVFGWALFLLGALFIGPMILLWQDVEIVFGPYDSPDNAWYLIAIDAILLLAAWTACRLLGAERKQFYSWYFITMMLTLASLAAFVSLCLFDTTEILPYGVRETEAAGWRGLFAHVPSIVWWGIGLRVAAVLLATIYVMQSRRLNVTVAKRVTPHDPYVSHAWTAATAPVRHPDDHAGSRYPDAYEEQRSASAGLATVTATAATAAVVADAAVDRSVETTREVRTETTTTTERTEARIEPTVAVPKAATVETKVVETVTTDAPDDRRLRARLKQLDDARAAGLISDAEYEARRLALVGSR